MQTKMYSIRDSATGVYHKPFHSLTHGEAERNFRALAQDPATEVHKHKQDFDLYYIGQYDDNSGKVDSLDTPQHIIKAADAAVPE